MSGRQPYRQLKLHEKYGEAAAPLSEKYDRELS